MSDGRQGDRDAYGDSFRVFAFAWACMHMIELLAWPFWMLAPWGWLVFLSCCSVVLRPGSVRRLALLVVASLVKTFAEMPFVPNHVLLTWLQNGVIIGTFCVLSVGRRASIDGGNWVAGFAPRLRAQVVTLYLSSVIQKLNWDYLDPAVSCAVGSYRQIASDLRFLPAGEWVAYPAIYGSLLIELAIPLLLLFGPTRLAGLVAALLFHGLLGFHENPGVYGFSIFVYANLVLFLPVSAHRRLARYAEWPVLRPLRIGNGKGLKWLLILCFFAVLRTQAWLYWNIGRDFEIFTFANRIALVFWLVLSLWLAWAFLVSVWATRRDRADTVLSRPPHGARPIWVGVACALLLFNAALPWIGGKTQTSFSMFSNLRTEFEENHVVLRRSHILGFQDDMVEVISSKPDLFAPDINRYSVQQYANEGAIVPMFELRRLVFQAGGAVDVQFVRDGVTLRAARDAAGVVSGAVDVFDPPGFWARKFLWFRRHTSFAGPMCCTH